MHQQQELDGVTYKVSDEEGKYALHFLLLFFRNISRVAIYLLWLFLLLFFRNITRVAIYLLWLRLLLLVFFYHSRRLKGFMNAFDPVTIDS